jgi:phospholipid transport system substrate-binding protein
MRSLYLFILAALFVGATVAAPAPEKIIHDQADHLLRRLSAMQNEDRNPDALEFLVTEIVAPYVDFTALSRLVLGKHWRRLSKEAQNRFEYEFSHLVIKTYASALADTSKLQISYLPVRADGKPGRVEVPTIITSEGNPPVSVSYKLYKKDSEWKVYDVAIEGISMALNYRSVFAERIKRDGIESVIDNFADVPDTVAIN